MRPSQQTWFFLRREPMYHKLQYSKVPKYDSSAAILGTVLGAFAGYLALATVGSGGTDLTDLTTLVAWALLGLGAVALSLEPRNHHSFIFFPPLALWLAPAASLAAAVGGRAAPQRERARASTRRCPDIVVSEGTKAAARRLIRSFGPRALKKRLRRLWA